MDINNAKRVGGGSVQTMADGRQVMMDTYQGSGGKMVRVGYELKE
jgi:hypothetical protein